MSAKNETVVLLLMVIYSSVAWASIFPVHPSYGDIAIDEKNQVFISLAPDGILYDNYTFHICGDGLSSGNLDKIISRQLGYKESACTTTHGTSSYPIAIGMKCSKCSGSETHVLRCCDVESVFDDSKKYCNSILTLSGPCKKGQSLYQHNNKGNRAYSGEVFIFPPISEAALGKTTPSMGLVGVKKEGDNCPDWRFIWKDSFSLDPSLATTICRQMGFTSFNPGYIMTLLEFENFYPYNNFSIWDKLIKDPFLQTSEIKCKSTQTCLACCDYNHKLENCNADGPFPSNNRDKLLVVRCTFYKEEYLPESGSRETCEYINGKHSPCRSYITMESSKFIAAIAVPVCFLLVICIILFVITIQLCLKCQCRNRCPRGHRAGYEHLNGEIQQGNQNQGGPNPRE